MIENRREIRECEQQLIIFLLENLGLNPKNYPLPNTVEEYEGGIMGSIGLGNPEISPYKKDLVQVKYVDSDEIEVIITLTQDTNNQLLDLDFWKVDFSKLLTYPLPKGLIFIET